MSDLLGGAQGDGTEPYFNLYKLGRILYLVRQEATILFSDTQKKMVYKALLKDLADEGWFDPDIRAQFGIHQAAPNLLYALRQEIARLVGFNFRFPMKEYRFLGTEINTMIRAAMKKEAGPREWTKLADALDEFNASRNRRFPGLPGFENHVVVDLVKTAREQSVVMSD